LDINNNDKKCYIFDQNADGDLNEDSYMEELHQREAARVEKKRVREARRQQRREQRRADAGEDQDLSQGDEEEEEVSQADSCSPVDKKEKLEAKKASQMKAVISNEAIDQVLLLTLINKAYIKETLWKEYQKQLDPAAL